MKWMAIISFAVEFNYSLVCVIVYARHIYMNIELLNGAHLSGSRSTDDDCGQ